MIKYIIAFFITFSTFGQDLIVASNSDNDLLCVSKLLYSDQTGSGQMCWKDFAPVSNTGGTSVTIGNAWRGSEEMGDGQMSLVGDELRIYVNPTIPNPVGIPGHNGTDDGNKRTEIFLQNSSGGFQANKVEGTEGWYGYTYRFGDNYVPDTTMDWVLMQIKGDDKDGFDEPAITLQSVENGVAGSTGGDLYIVHPISDDVQTYTRTPLGVKPVAGQKLNLVFHFVHGKGTSGLIEVWVDGVKVVDLQNIPTMWDIPSGDGAGTLKTGIYASSWASTTNINASAAAGVTELEVFIGPMKYEIRTIGQEGYGTNRYNFVKPKSSPSTSSTPEIVTTTVTALVTDGNDDAEERISNNSYQSFSDDLELTNDAGNHSIVGIMFRGLDIPAGAVITNAQVQFSAKETQTGAVPLLISTEVGATPIDFSGSAKPLSRTRSSDTAWNPDDWLAADDRLPAQLTSDFSASIQETVDNASYTQNDPIVVFISTTAFETNKRNAWSFNGSGTAPEITVTYYIE